MTTDPTNEGRVAIARLLRRTTARVRETHATLPEGAWRRWAAALAVGLVLCLALTWLATSIGERLATAGALDWEADAIRGLEDDRLLSFHDATWLQAFGSSAMVIPIVVLAAGMAAWMRHPFRAAGMVAALVFAKVLVFTGWSLWERARPDFINEGIAVPAGLGSFPSGHVVQIVAIYGLLIYFWTQASRSWLERIVAWLLLAVLVVATAAARLRIGAHWPSDLVAGAAIGIALLATIIVAERRAATGSQAQRGPSRG